MVKETTRRKLSNRNQTRCFWRVSLTRPNDNEFVLDRLLPGRIVLYPHAQATPTSKAWSYLYVVHKKKMRLHVPFSFFPCILPNHACWGVGCLPYSATDPRRPAI